MSNKNIGYQISEEDIESTIKYLKINDPENADREGAIRFLEAAQATMHLAAHKIVEDEKSKEKDDNSDKKED